MKTQKEHSLISTKDLRHLLDAVSGDMKVEELMFILRSSENKEVLFDIDTLYSYIRQLDQETKWRN